MPKFSKTKYAPCYTTHKPFTIWSDNSIDYKIMGGNASKAPKGYDIYVTLDIGATPRQDCFPWDEAIEVPYLITDMQAPTDLKGFKKLIDWLCWNVKAGKKVHVGCIGGHGRTGLVLCALYKRLNPDEKQVIQYIRKHYCKKAVESSVQVNFLVKHFGVDDAPITKKLHAPMYGDDLGIDWNKKSVAAGYNIVPPIESQFCIFNGHDIYNIDKLK